jgi:hypothetical protein
MLHYCRGGSAEPHSDALLFPWPPCLLKITKFCAKDIADALNEVNTYDKTRVDYDACRMSFESLKDTSSAKLPAAEAQFLESYNTLSDVRQATWAKLCNVEEGKAKFFQGQLKALSNAYSMFLAGNNAGFEDAMAKLENPNEEEDSATEEGL